jgi:hypothetical protein
MDWPTLEAAAADAPPRQDGLSHGRGETDVSLVVREVCQLGPPAADDVVVQAGGRLVFVRKRKHERCETPAVERPRFKANHVGVRVAAQPRPTAQSLLKVNAMATTPKSDGFNNRARITMPSNCAARRLACATVTHFVADAAARASESAPPDGASGAGRSSDLRRCSSCDPSCKSENPRSLVITILWAVGRQVRYGATETHRLRSGELTRYCAWSTATELAASRKNARIAMRLPRILRLDYDRGLRQTVSTSTACCSVPNHRRPLRTIPHGNREAIAVMLNALIPARTAWLA